MVTNGSTTWWEGWNTYIPGAGVNGNSSFRSFNHLPFGSVAEWIWKVMVGVNLDPDQPGYQNTIVKPEPGGGITNTLGAFDSIHGPIVISWTNNMPATNVFSLDATVPANTTASIYIPSTNNLANITEGGVAAATALGVWRWYITNPPSYIAGATVFEVGSGTYRFQLIGY
jgi:alpha-L-rhamnosidase